MKYSFMSFSGPELDLDKSFKIAKLYGYDGFEPRIEEGHMHGIETNSSKTVLREARLKSEDSGIKICCIATSCSYANPSNTEENIELTKRSIDLAAEVNSPAIRVFGGNIPEGISREKGFDLIVDALTKLSDYALHRGITICVETHDSWCEPQAVADVMKSVNHSAIAVNWDIMHPVLRVSCTITDSFKILKPWIKHVHVHDGLITDRGLEFKPIGEGKVDHKTAIRLLKDSGYNGFISGEWIDWEPYNIHLPRELKTMKSFEQ
ncbi:MAG TPA: sugar phosphate isomerase/epimerase [Clostridiaceae bacterium]|jgi:sugar phosphate isomerase/epimerase|nr:sugar phosphate isomerase/epimerase [Clostridiaceae bacterium]